MTELQKMGGAAALIMAASFVVGIVFFISLFLPADYFEEDADPVQNAAFLADNQALATISYTVAFVVFGVFLVVLALALYDRLRAGAPATAQVATAFGLIWAVLVIATGMVAAIGIGRIADLHASDPAQAGSLWLALDLAVSGLGGEMEIAGGLWVLLVSWAALRARELPRALNYFGALIGLAGLLTVVPALGGIGIAFGLGLIVWFAWLGIIMLRSGTAAAAHG